MKLPLIDSTHLILIQVGALSLSAYLVMDVKWVSLSIAYHDMERGPTIIILHSLQDGHCSDLKSEHQGEKSSSVSDCGVNGHRDDPPSPRAEAKLQVVGRV